MTVKINYGAFICFMNAINSQNQHEYVFFTCFYLVHQIPKNIRSGTIDIYTTVGGLLSKFAEFLAARSQFDSDHGVDFSAPTFCQSVIFVRPLFAFYFPLFLRKNNNNAEFPHRRDVYAARLMGLRNRSTALRERWCHRSTTDIR